MSLWRNWLEPTKADSDGTLESLERQYIIRVLRETNGVIAGPHGAAVRLGMKRTTLQSTNPEDGNFREVFAIRLRDRGLSDLGRRTSDLRLQISAFKA